MTRTDPEALRLQLSRVDDISGADDETRLDVSGRAEDVEAASAALRRAITALHEADDEAWKRYASDIHHATLRFDAAISMAAASLRAERAASKPALDDALESVAQRVRARADEIRLQTHLGELEARDAGLHATEDLEAAGHRVATVIRTLRDDAGASLAGLRTAAGEAIDGVALALQDLRPRR